MISQQDFGGRRAPYAPISALEKFLERMRDRSVPDYVDHRFLRRMNVASNNEYSLLSALKFLGILDDRGRPTHAYRQLQRADSFQATLRHLVDTAYAPVFEAGVERRSEQELVEFFRSESSPSQAKNAARFFHAVCRLAGLSVAAQAAPGAAAVEHSRVLPTDSEAGSPGPDPSPAPRESPAADLLGAKLRLLEKLPPYDRTWPPELYRDICVAFQELAATLDRS